MTALRERRWLVSAMRHRRLRSRWEYAAYELGPLKKHRNEESRSRYLASLFRVMFSSFHGTIINRPEETIHGQVTTNGKIEHVFYAFSNSVIAFVEVKANLSISREDAVAQVIAECDGLDFQNSTHGYWCPILGVLSDGVSFQLFIYDSSTRPGCLVQRKPGHSTRWPMALVTSSVYVTVCPFFYSKIYTNIFSVGQQLKFCTISFSLDIM